MTCVFEVTYIYIHTHTFFLEGVRYLHTVYMPGKAFISEDANAEKWVENEDVIARAPLLKAKLEEGYQFPGDANGAEEGVLRERSLGSSSSG